MQLRVYGRALTALRMVGPLAQRIARVDRDLARQLRRAGASVVLNLAEGECADGGNRRARFDNALGSAKECIACLHCGEALLYVVAGECEQRIGKAWYHLDHGSLVRVPRGVPHQTVNLSPDPCRLICAQSSPKRRFEPSHGMGSK